MRGAARHFRQLPAAISLLAAAPALAATLSLPPDAGVPSGSSTVVPLQVDDASGFLGTDLVITYDPAVVLATGVATTAISSAHTLTVNLLVAGEIRVALYGAGPLSGSGTLLEIGFDSIGSADSQTPLDIVTAEVNEGAIPIAIQSGQYCIDVTANEVQDVAGTLQPSGSSTMVLSWLDDPLAESFNLYRSPSPDLDELECLSGGVTGNSETDDGIAPPAGGIFYHVVTSVDCGDESTLGTGSGGAPPRPAPPVCL